MKPKHAVFISIALDALYDLQSGIIKLDKVIVVLADGNDMGSGPRAQDTFPFIYFRLIDVVDSIRYVGIRQNSRPRIRVLKNLETKKMVGMLMSDVDNR